ncbi:MAG: EcsC family protein [Firmicutes bacterium]|nr:EcsC family protein [Bacillota bacterium]
MSLYYQTIQKELTNWEQQMLSAPSLRNRLSKGVQNKIQNIVPQKVQDLITAAIKTMIETVISGSSLLTKQKVFTEPPLSESDFLVERAFAVYYKMAVAQGVGFGLGGLLVNLGDLPALMTVKVKFLFDCCKLYGYNPDEKVERLFILHIFQLAYCGDARRLELFPIMKNWNEHSEQIEMNWEKLQIEYRDYMDISKLLQILPVVGAAAGGAANHRLMKKLKITAMNCYRLRYLHENKI